jgi:hypothetical protein
MVKSPFQIIFELLVLLINTTIEGLGLVIDKLVELFESLVFIAKTGLAGLVISSIIGGIVVIFVSKFLFGSTKSLMKILLVYLAFILIVTLLFVLTTTQTPPTP